MTPTSGRLRRTYKKWFWNSYDYIGTLIVVNMLWLLCALPLFTLPASTAGLFRVSVRIAAYQEVGVREFFVGIRVHFWRSIRLCGIYTVCLIVLVVNIIFYGRMMDQWPWAGGVLSGGMLWVILFVALTGVFTFPLLIQTDEPVRAVLKKGVLLVLDNIGFTSMLFVSGMTVLLLGAVTGAGLVFGAVSVVSVLYSTGLRELQKKYTRPSPDQPLLDASTAAFTEEDLEEPRGWRDLFRPWDYR